MWQAMIFFPEPPSIFIATFLNLVPPESLPNAGISNRLRPRGRKTDGRGSLLRETLNR